MFQRLNDTLNLKLRGLLSWLKDTLSLIQVQAHVTLPHNWSFNGVLLTLLLVTMSVFCVLAYFNTQKAGVTISFLVGFVVIIALLTPTKRQKLAFTILTAVFVFLESRSINAEYNERKFSFDTTLSRLEESINNITGANAFPYVAPQPSFGDSIPLIIWNAGDYPLIGVTVTIMDSNSFTSGADEFGGTEIDVGYCRHTAIEH